MSRKRRKKEGRGRRGVRKRVVGRGKRRAGREKVEEGKGKGGRGGGKSWKRGREKLEEGERKGGRRGGKSWKKGREKVEEGEGKGGRGVVSRKGGEEGKTVIRIRGEKLPMFTLQFGGKFETLMDNSLTEECWLRGTC
ncbi:hypothetical protein Pmani_021250 [Petrolisthes manimaculis]|uniref:Uncharacterized protein n=1 Tax=Petrolisthes manimaculis TaxID=1843537 RepID=A0AAE1PE74_9EUCA|nr:hypothetical protein Pmani_021250 [Petrolisthes manimaculis]